MAEKHWRTPINLNTLAAIILKKTQKVSTKHIFDTPSLLLPHLLVSQKKRQNDKYQNVAYDLNNRFRISL